MATPALTFFTDTSNSDFVPSLTQNGLEVVLSTFPSYDSSDNWYYEQNVFFYVSGAPRDTLVAYGSSDWVAVVPQASVYWDDDENKGVVMLTIKQNTGFAREFQFGLQGDGIPEPYVVTVKQESSVNLKLSGMSVLNATCDCSGADCSCSIDEYHYSCSRKSLVVVANFSDLPKGEEGTTYFVGSHTTGGFTEYVWSNASGWVEMGSASASLVNPATVEILGLAKLSTSDVLTAGAVVGMNSGNQLMVPLATVNTPGAVRLGSSYLAQYAKPYHVGVTTNGSGQLVFNLRQTQSDGSPGCLQYNNTVGGPYEMFITEASATQMGIVKLCSTINGYTDEQLDGMRNTHAASVGLLLDKVESYVEEYVSDERLGGYFDAWANGLDLAGQIMSEHKEALVGALDESLLSDERFRGLVETNAEAWLSMNLKGLFSESIREWAESVARDEALEYWTSDIYSYIDNRISEQLPEQVTASTEATIANWLSVPENLKSVADSVMAALDDDLEAKAEETARNYSADVFNGVKTFKVNGADKSFAEWVAAEIVRLVSEQTTGMASRIDNVVNYLKNPTYSGKTVLWTGGENWGDDTADKEIALSESMVNFDRLCFVTSFGTFSFYTKDIRQGTVEGKVRGAWGSKNDHVQHCTVRRKNDNLLAVQLEQGNLTEVYGYRHTIS